MEEPQKSLANETLSCVGATLWIDNESDLDAVTALSGSGPAYFYYLMESMIEAGISLGLSEQQSKQLTLSTAVGSAKLVAQSELDPAKLREAVTSKGGTTEAAINTLNESNVKEIIISAIKNAEERSRELSKSN